MSESKQINVKDYKGIVILSGAGISVASGIAPFRGPGGLWTDHDIERMATAQALARDPEVVWNAFSSLRTNSRNTKPNPTHFALAELEQKHPYTTILTQNIDGLHQAAGSRNVLELHGNIHRTRCTSCSREPFYDTNDKFRMCELCGAPLRYDIVLFNENLDSDVITGADHAVRNCQLFIATGTSGIVYPAAGFAYLAKQHRAHTVLVNLEHLPGGERLYDNELIGKAEELFPTLFKY